MPSLNDVADEVTRRTEEGGGAMKRCLLALLCGACSPCPDGTILPLWSVEPCPRDDEFPMAMPPDTGDEQGELFDPCAPMDELASPELDGGTMLGYTLASSWDYTVPLELGGPHDLGLLDRSIQWLPAAVGDDELSLGWEWLGGAPPLGATVAIDPTGLEPEPETHVVWRLEILVPTLALQPAAYYYAIPWIVVDDPYDGIGYHAGGEDDDGELRFDPVGPWTQVSGQIVLPAEEFGTAMEWQFGPTKVIGRSAAASPHYGAPVGSALQSVGSDGVGVMPLAGWCVWSVPLPSTDETG